METLRSRNVGQNSPRYPQSLASKVEIKLALKKYTGYKLKHTKWTKDRHHANKPETKRRKNMDLE